MAPVLPAPPHIPVERGHLEQTQRAWNQAVDAIKNANRLLTDHMDHSDVKTIVALFVGPEAICNPRLMKEVQVVISKLAKAGATFTEEYYTLEHLLWKNHADAHEHPEKLIIRFAKADLYTENTDGSFESIAAEASLKFDLIILRPTALEMSQGRYEYDGRLLDDMKMPKGIYVDDIMANLPSLIVHETAHCKVKAKDVCLEDKNLATNFQEVYPWLKRDGATDKYTVYSFDACQVLANSPQNWDALKNAESITGIVMVLDFIERHHQLNVSDGWVTKRRGSILS